MSERTTAAAAAAAAASAAAVNQAATAESETKDNSCWPDSSDSSDLEQYEECLSPDNVDQSDAWMAATISPTTATTAAAADEKTTTTTTTTTAIVTSNSGTSSSVPNAIEGTNLADGRPSTDDDVIMEVTRQVNDNHEGNDVMADAMPAAIEADENNDKYESGDEDDNLIVQFLGEANRIAEAHLAARKEARAEARSIRLHELEKRNKDEDDVDNTYDMHAVRKRSSVSAVASCINGEGEGYRDLKHELKETEERYRRAMLTNAQLDNERASNIYEIQRLKDELEELRELNVQVQRELKVKSLESNAMKRNVDRLSEELTLVQGQLEERDSLIADTDLVVVTIENDEGTDVKRRLVSVENAKLLNSVEGSLDNRLGKFHEERCALKEEIQQLKDQLANQSSSISENTDSLLANTSDIQVEANEELNSLISDYKVKLETADHNIANLQDSLANLESELLRYKSAREAVEKAEAALKAERTELQRDKREETSNKSGNVITESTQ